MKICLDAQSAVVQRAGVGRYTKVLAQHLGQVAPENDVHLVYFDFKRQGKPFDAPGATWHPIKWCPGRFAEQAWKRLSWPPYDFFSGPADVFHFPNFVVPPLRKGHAVVTIHDMAFMRYPELAEDRNVNYLTHTIRKTVERADAIITVSQFSADEIAELLNVDPKRIFVVYHGISDTFSAPNADTIGRVRKTLHLDRPYILSVGTIEPRKNLPFLVELFESLTDYDGDLVLAGGRGWKDGPIFERIESSPRRDRIRYIQYVDDQTLPALYAGADMLAITSVYEGFGFPPLEAMRAGTPVLTSAAGSIAEVTGDAASVIRGFDPDEWKEAARRVLSDTELRQQLRDRGFRHAAGFTWLNAARKTHDVYRQVAG